MRKDSPMLIRIGRKVRLLDSGCWEWTGQVRPDGYLRAVIRRTNLLASPNTIVAVNANKTHCSRGHLLPENRDCPLCRCIRQAAYMERKKARG